MRMRLLLALATVVLALLAGPTVAAASTAGDDDVNPKERIEGVDREERGLGENAPDDETGILVSLGLIAVCSALVIGVGLKPHAKSPGHPGV